MGFEAIQLSIFALHPAAVTLKHPFDSVLYLIVLAISEVLRLSEHYIHTAVSNFSLDEFLFLRSLLVSNCGKCEFLEVACHLHLLEFRDPVLVIRHSFLEAQSSLLLPYLHQSQCFALVVVMTPLRLSNVFLQQVMLFIYLLLSCKSLRDFTFLLLYRLLSRVFELC